MLLIKATEALDKALSLPCATVLDVGCGDGFHAHRFRQEGRQVTTVSLIPPADILGDYLALDLPKFDLIWASHVLEHQRSPGLFLDKCFNDLNDGGWLCVTVPPAKPELVGGHVTIWNEGLLLYQLILAGFDCKNASVKRYGYNISVVVQKVPADLPELINDFGDIEALARFFPVSIKHGDIIEGPINW